MPTAEEMYDYCVRYGFGKGMTRNWGIKHFSIIEKQLMTDEKPQLCFIGLHNYVSMIKHDGNFAYCVTDRRIMMAQKKLMGEVFQSVLFDRLNDVTMNTGMLLGILTVDTMNEKFNVCVDKLTVSKINDRIHSVLERVRKRPDVIATSNVIASSVATQSVADEILKFKRLLDMGAISQEEFDNMKAQLLGF